MAQHLDPTNADAVAQWIVAARKRLAAQPAEVQQRPEPERTITGTVTLAPQLSPEVPAGGALFIIARQGNGPPLAVKRIPNPSFPVRFALGPAGRMLADTPFAGEVTLLARLKRDGTAGPARPRRPRRQGRDGRQGGPTGGRHRPRQSLLTVIADNRKEGSMTTGACCGEW